jgi:hypothetical protein
MALFAGVFISICLVVGSFFYLPLVLPTWACFLAGIIGFLVWITCLSIEKDMFNGNLIAAMEHISEEDDPQKVGRRIG